MLTDSDDFATLYREANLLRKASRFADAAKLYERALQAGGGTEEERLEAGVPLAECLLMTGQHTEGLAHLSELYTATHDRPGFESIAYRALYYKVDALRNLEGSVTEPNYERRLQIIEDGLRWLHDIAHEEWRHALLVMKSYVLAGQLKLAEALDAAEEAYRLRKAGVGPGYNIGVYARRVSDCARALDQVDRGLAVLEETEEVDLSSVTRAQLLVERVRLLLAAKPPRLVEAMEAARKAARLREDLQAPRTQLLLDIVLAQAAAEAGSYPEAMGSLRAGHDYTMKDDSLDRGWLLREERKALLAIQGSLPEEAGAQGSELRELVAGLLCEVEAATAAEHRESV